MDEWDPIDGIDWLTGQYTYKRRRLLNTLKKCGWIDTDWLAYAER